MRKRETRTPGKFPIDLGAGPLFSMTYEVFYFPGFPIDFFEVWETKAKWREVVEGMKCKIAIRGPCFAIREISTAVRRVRPSGFGFLVHVLSAVCVNNTLN
jgi:hypothetical protein